MRILTFEQEILQDLTKSLEKSMFWFFGLQDEEKFNSLFPSYFKSLRGYLPENQNHAEEIRKNYFLMICGVLESQRWPQKQTIYPHQIEPFGKWINLKSFPRQNSWCLITGDFENCVLAPAIYKGKKYISFVDVSKTQYWMKFPRIEDVFQDALKSYIAQKN